MSPPENIGIPQSFLNKLVKLVVYVQVHANRFKIDPVWVQKAKSPSYSKSLSGKNDKNEILRLLSIVLGSNFNKNRVKQST
jgi:hypothetical protein